MVISVDYSHRLGVVHRDIKLKNMVLSEIDGRYLLKLCDFGFSKVRKGTFVIRVLRHVL